MKIKLYNNGKMPKYQHNKDSALDCYSSEFAHWKLEDGFWTVNISLGFGVLVPHEFGMFLLSRSGQGFNHSVTLINSVGLIDRSFGLNEIKCKLIMQKITEEAPKPIEIGDRVCQMVLMETPRVYLKLVTDSVTDNKDGFGSSGGFDL